MKQLYRALAGASLAVLAACVSRPQLTHADLEPIRLSQPARIELVARCVKAALAEYSWKILEEQPGHLVVQLSREPFNLSVKLDIVYTPEAVTIKFLEMASLDAEPIDQIQISQYHRWTRNLRQSIVDSLNRALGRAAQAAY